MNRCISCGDLLPCEGRQICWRCEHIVPSVKNKPIFADILEANAYCKQQEWVSYSIRHIDGHGYVCEEIK